MRALPGEVRFAARALGRRPGLTAAAVLPIALAIAITTALFSVVDGLVFRPLPFERSDQLVAIDFRSVGGQPPPVAYRRELTAERAALSAALHASLVDATHVGQVSYFDAAAARMAGIDPMAVDARFFHVLGLSPVLGPGFATEEELSPAVNSTDREHPVPVILGHGLWQQRFGRDQDVLGIHDLAGRQVRVVGVMGPGVKFPGETNVWALRRAFPDRPATYGRLAPDTTVEQLAARFPQLRITSLDDAIRPGDTVGVFVLFTAAVLLLLVAWVQVAALLLSGALGRVREIGVRLAIGAGRMRVVRQFALENAIVATLALALAWSATPLITHFIIGALPQELARGQYLMPDVRAFAFGCLLSLGGLGLLTLVPGAIVRRTSALRLLQGRAGELSIGSDRLRRLLLGAQMSVTTLLLYLAGLTAHSFVRAMTFDFGFDTQNVLLFDQPLPPAPGAGDLSRFAGTDPVFEARYEQKLLLTSHSLEALRHTPGVVAAATFFRAPLESAQRSDEPILAFDGRPFEPPLAARGNTVSRDFIRALGARLVAGDSFDHPDYAGMEDVAVVNETLARQLGGSVSVMGMPIQLDVIGRRFRIRWFDGRVIGVVKDLVDTAPGIPPEPQFFTPTDRAAAAAVVAIRATPSVEAALPAVRATLERIWGPMPPQHFGLLVDSWRGVLLPYRSQTLLVSLIAACCLPLGAIGLTGASLYFVRARGRELAIRLALGADPRALRRIVVLRAVTAVAVGILVGVTAGAGLARVITSQLFHVRTVDPWTILIVTMALIGFAWLATLAPARRAARIDPAEALRHDG